MCFSVLVSLQLLNSGVTSNISLGLWNPGSIRLVHYEFCLGGVEIGRSLASGFCGFLRDGCSKPSNMPFGTINLKACIRIQIISPQPGK